jgi:hypothetical protein
MKCGDQTYERQIDSKIDAMIESLPKLQDQKEDV